MSKLEIADGLRGLTPDKLRIAELEAALREARGMLRGCGFDEPEDQIDPDIKASWERGLAKIDAALK